MRIRRRKPKGPKRVSYELIDRDSIVGRPIYSMLRELVKEHHTELLDARIALAWCTSWKPDRDGRCTLGKCKKASDLDRELANFDFIILIKKSFWYDTTPEFRLALLDHELCHATVSIDERTNEPVYDERGRKVWRTRKHDIEEFIEVVARHRIYRHELEAMYAAMVRAAREGWKPCDACKDGTNPGWVEVDEGGVKRLAKCQCVVEWNRRYAEAVPA